MFLDTGTTIAEVHVVAWWLLIYYVRIVLVWERNKSYPIFRKRCCSADEINLVGRGQYTKWTYTYSTEDPGCTGKYRLNGVAET